MSCTASKKLLLGLMSSFLVSSASLCGVCPPGFFVEKECTETSERICKPCPFGTYMDVSTLRNKCYSCRTCSSPQVVARACTATTNTVCKCSDGYYFNTELFICFPCTSCKEGTGVIEECSDTTDTVCESCKEETYSNLISSTQRCSKCRICHAGETVGLNCTRQHDRECVASEITKLRIQNKSKMRTVDKEDQNHRLKPDNTTIKSEKPIEQTTTQEPTKKSSTSEETNQVESPAIEETVLRISVGIVLVAFVIVAVVIGCCVWKQKRSTGHVVSGVRVTGKTDKETKTTVVVDIGGNSQVLSKAKPRVDHRIENVNCGLHNELNNYLNPKDRWKKVAARLGFSENEVANFELQTGKATAEMLSSWGHSRDAKLSVLLDVFMSLGFDTAVDIVDSYMRQPASV